MITSIQLISAIVLGTSGLAPFPPDEPSEWVCPSNSPPSEQQLKDFCDSYQGGSSDPGLGMPAPISELEAKNAYDEALLAFLQAKTYRKLDGWEADKKWRLTGPYVGDFPNGSSYGVHPAVRIWYSGEMVEWMCSDRTIDIEPGAMIIKEMRSIDATALKIDPTADCMVIEADPDTIEPSSWAVMVRTNTTHDGWYWPNPGQSGNPPIVDPSAFAERADVPDSPVDRNPHWYPTGDLFSDTKIANVVSPYSLFGAYCLNCHASAAKESTFSTLNNIVGDGLNYRHFADTRMKELIFTPAFAGTAHDGEMVEAAKKISAKAAAQPGWAFTEPLPEPAPGFAEFYGTLGPSDYSGVWPLRLPGETYDHITSGPDGPGQFLTSDQCIGCHDATVSNASTPNMLITDPETGNAVNLSVYSEWRASPMGLAGRDPIFFSQLQSETNNLQSMTECIENTCLHCHGVMGQRQQAIDTESPDAECKDIFAIAPPPEVPFGKPFALDQVTEYQGDGAKYGGLARDGISCAVCHHISEEGLDTDATHTGNFITGPPDQVYGPYEDDTIIPKPMEHALGITPGFGEQTKSSALCGSCHNILLPVFNNDGTPHLVATVDGENLYASYEQTTALEWSNSDFRYDTPCQTCHMPNHYKSMDLAGTEIANIESSAFAPTDERLPDEDITLTPRDNYARHALHGLNLFLNEMFQQFPMVLGIRQIDYMGDVTNQPALITSSRSMQRMAKNETAEIEIVNAIETDDGYSAQVLVTNKVGHFLPSGVGFRRVFIEFTALDADGNLLWASGRTNDLGAILDGTTDNILPTEYGNDDSTQYQPHYQIITEQNQVQIYQEVIKDSDGILTTSFLRRAQPVKDNRLRPKGFDPEFYAKNPSPYIQLLAHTDGRAGEDPYYTDPRRTGQDLIVYNISLPEADRGKVAKMEVKLYSQSIPPSYLQQRFNDAFAEKDQIQRLYYLTSHLNAGDGTPIESWKVLVGSGALNF
ncbi:MAG: hypothetical protein DHS20C11_05230 [Lysobacteraceae bacterium]|nr:MAG: hypothetical protein DHS20C11_05230 [Xanthomonadaceae bacterium]